MQTFVLVMRYLCLFLGVLSAFVYVLNQLWQKVPAEPFQLKTQDYLLLSLVAGCFGLGFNSSWGLLAVLPLLFAKFLASIFVRRERLLNKGRWVEIEWFRFTPKGFNLPKDASAQLDRLPKNQHILLPRLFSKVILHFVLKNMQKNRKKVLDQSPYNRQQEGAQIFDGLIQKLIHIGELKVSETEKIALPFGELRVKRL